MASGKGHVPEEQELKPLGRSRSGDDSPTLEELEIEESLSTDALLGRHEATRQESPKARGNMGIEGMQQMFFSNPFFCLLTLAVYGLLQGAGSQFYSMGFFYFWKDVEQVPPDKMQRYEVMSNAPWDMKPAWGFLSDAYPPKSLYLTIGSVLGVASLGILSSSSKGTNGPALSLCCFVQVNVALSMIDVMMDGMVVEWVRDAPEAAAVMYSFGAIVHFVFAALGGLTKGSLQSRIGSGGQFLMTASLLAIVASFSFCQVPPKPGPPNSGPSSGRSGVSRSMRKLKRALALPCVYKPMLYNFLRQAVVPSFGAAYFYFLTNSQPEQIIIGEVEGLKLDPWPDVRSVPPPGFTPEWLGLMSTIGSIVSMLGVVIYNKCLQGFQFRTVFAACHVVQVIFSCLDLIMVCRWNITWLGIPDKYFALISDDVMKPIINRVQDLPMQIFAATALCAPGLEGTTVALLQATGHLGHDVSKWWGAQVLYGISGGDTKGETDSLWLCVIVRTLLKIVPLFLTFLLIPSSSPETVTLPPELRAVGEMDKDRYDS